MSYLMHYDEDWPPAPETAEPQSEPPLRLWQKLAFTAILYALIWAAGALLLHARMHGADTYWTSETPARGHTLHVTTTLPPHPATTSRNP